MPRLKLTTRALDKLKAPTIDGKQQLYWDTELKGFGVLLSGITNARTFIVQRDIGGKTRRVTVGPTNVLSLDAARQQAQTILADFYMGTDPKAKQPVQITLQAALDNYLKADKLRPNSIRDYKTSVERHLKPWLDRPLHEIDAEAVRARHAEIAASIKAGARSTGAATANGAMRVLRALWNDAATKDTTLPANPTRALRRHWMEVPRRERLVKVDELPRFFAAIQALENTVARDYLTLLLFTGLRREEAATLTWADVDLAARVLRIPASRTKAKRKLELPLTDFIYDMLSERHRGLGNDRFVFPSVGKSGHIAEPKFPLNQVAIATGIQVSAHDLRRTFITVAESCDISPIALKALVNHSLNGDVTSGYVIVTPERLREPAQRVCDRLKALCMKGYENAGT